MKDFLKFGIVLIIIAFSTNSYSIIIYVDKDATGADLGTTWNDAFTDINSALTSCSNGDEIWVAEGTYYPNIGNDNGINATIDFLGGFNGTEITCDERNWNLFPTILSGDIGVPDLITDNSNRIITIFSEDVNISGFIFEAAYADPEDGYVLHAPLGTTKSCTISDCIFRNNILNINCGITLNGIASISTLEVLIENCLFYDNSSQYSVIFNFANCNLVVQNCTFAKNNLTSEFSRVINGDNIDSELIYNCIISGSYPAFTNVDAVHNSILENGAEGSDYYSNIKVSDPLFIDENANNFILHYSSSGIDTGDSNFSESTFDVGHNDRIIGSSIDIGAYEYQPNEIVYVDESAPGNEAGTSWTNAYTRLSDAVEEMGAGFDYWVAAGTYYASYLDNPNSYINLQSNINIIGGFDGTETSIEQRNILDNPTIVSGEIGSSAVTDNSKNLFYLNNVSNITFDGLIIEKSYKDPTNFTDDRGAILSIDSDFRLINCILRDNEAYYEPCINAESCDFSMENCLVYNNTATNGGLIGDNSGFSSISIINSTITDNSIGGNSTILAGLVGSSIEIFNSIVWDGENHAIISPFGNLIAENCIIESGTTFIDSYVDVATDNPGFTDSENNDYTLGYLSPAINYGENSNASQSNDLIKNNRISHEFIDLGCFEFQFGTIFYVDQDATGSPSGASWENAYTDLSEALLEIDPFGFVYVAEGTYFPSSFNSNSTMNIQNGVTVVGGFVGNEISPFERNVALYPTIISGNIGDPEVSTDNSKVLMEISNISDEVVIDGFIFEDSYTGPGYVSEQRGALMITNANVTIDNSIFRNNIHYAESAVNGTLMNLTMNNCLIHDNVATSGGLVSGGATSDISVINLTNITVTDNSIVSTNKVLGALSNTTIKLYNSIIWNGAGNNVCAGSGNCEAYNCIIQSGTSDIDLFSDISDVDPQFEDPSSNDYYLSAGSEAINNGNNSNVNTNFDLGNQERIQDSFVDLGCYEGEDPYVSCLGDANRDGVVNILDMLAVSSFFNCSSGCDIGDANFDGVIDIIDLLSVSSYFGIICP